MEKENDNARRISLAASALLLFTEEIGIGDSTETGENNFRQESN
ncbi:hypothetical protein [Erwinia amylovora]|nr:hypothetical protein [Erwinia amylovora]